LPASVNLHDRLEHLSRQRNARRLQTFVELGTNSSSAEPAHHFSGFRNARFLEKEDILQRDDVLLHSNHFRDVCDTTRSVAETRYLDEEIDRGRYLLTNRPDSHVRVPHADHHFKTSQSVARGVGVNRGERSIVTRVHRLQHVETLLAANLADDDA